MNGTNISSADLKVNSNAVRRVTSIANTVGCMATTKRRPLTKAEQSAAKAVRDLFEKAKRETGLTQEKLAHELGWKNNSAVSQFINGSVPINTDAAVKFAKYFKTTVAAIYPEVAHDLAAVSSLRTNFDPGPYLRGSVPLISWVTAGLFEPTSDPYMPGDAEEWLACPARHSDQTFCLKVRGDSMLPEYPDGEIIFVDPLLEPRHNDDVIVRLVDRDETTFKQLRVEGPRVYLRPRNPDWPEKIIEINEKAVIKGVVIFSGRMRR